MASLPYIPPKKVITNGAMVGDLYSQPTNLQQCGAMSYTLSWTGTPTGTFEVLICNDYVYTNPSVADPTPQNHGTWSAVDLSSSIAASGGAGGANINVPLRGSAWMMLHYIHSASTGVLQATVAGKQSS